MCELYVKPISSSWWRHASNTTCTVRCAESVVTETGNLFATHRLVLLSLLGRRYSAPTEIRRVLASVVCWKSTDVSEEHVTSSSQTRSQHETASRALHDVNIPEDGALHNHRCENIKFYKWDKYCRACMACDRPRLLQCVTFPSFHNAAVTTAPQFLALFSSRQSSGQAYKSGLYIAFSTPLPPTAYESPPVSWVLLLFFSSSMEMPRGYVTLGRIYFPQHFFESSVLVTLSAVTWGGEINFTREGGDIWGCF
jgi:hypothetical protein